MAESREYARYKRAIEKAEQALDAAANNEEPDNRLVAAIAAQAHATLAVARGLDVLAFIVENRDFTRA